MKNFEEQFPSLKGEEYYLWFCYGETPEMVIETDKEEYDEDDFIEKGYYHNGTIKQHCLDKTKVREAIIKLLNENKYCLREYKYAFKDLLKELGLEDVK